jgi:predicted secreted hydrolase
MVPRRRFLRQLGLALLLPWRGAPAEPPRFAAAAPDRALALPQDFGAHPDFRTEWWYLTGWLRAPDGKPLGFQLTFFRSATEVDRANPSRFAPAQLIFAHAALSDPARGKLLHDQRSARAGFGLAYAQTGNTDIKLGDWRLRREADGRYRADAAATGFTLALTLAPTQPPMAQGENGYWRRSPQPGYASHYYSEPQLRAAGRVVLGGRTIEVDGDAWLDHEWGSTMLPPDAAGWDWLGVNLADGSALMATVVRARNGAQLWAHASLRDAAGRIEHFGPAQVEFSALRRWRSPRTGAAYPVELQVRTGARTWHVQPLMDDQEFDARRSTGTTYWEGAVTIARDGRPAGRGYLELTGYLQPLRL